jgi:hypothetical protein
VPSDPKLGFHPTKQAISRIAKEGRKYGVSLGVITQRPGELDQTILSQCSTIFAMRLANDKDQEIIRSAIPDCSSSIISFLSSVDNREAIAFGEAVSVPMRMRFMDVPSAGVPKTVSREVHSTGEKQIDLRAVISQMRNIPVGDDENEDEPDFAMPFGDMHGHYQDPVSPGQIRTPAPSGNSQGLNMPAGYTRWSAEPSTPPPAAPLPAAGPDRMDVQSVRKRLFQK